MSVPEEGIVEWDERAASARLAEGLKARAPGHRRLASTATGDVRRGVRTIPIAWTFGAFGWAVVVCCVDEIFTTRAHAHLAAATNVVVFACLAGVVTIGAALLQRRLGAPRTGEALCLGIGQLVALWPVVVIVGTLTR